MTNSLRLHYAPDNASLCVRLALQELAVGYETVLVDRTSQAHKSAEYLSLNPNGLIPVLETDQGAIFETGAILMWLDETHGRLMPAIGTPQRMHAIQWMIWLSNTLHTTLPMMFYPTHCANGDYSPTHRKAEQRLKAHLDVLPSAQTVYWLESDRPSIHAYYLAPMLRWAALYGGGDTWFDLKDWSRLHAFALKFETRDSVQQAILAEGLGQTPFSNPAPCNPPEGSAL